MIQRGLASQAVLSHLVASRHAHPAIRCNIYQFLFVYFRGKINKLPFQVRHSVVVVVVGIPDSCLPLGTGVGRKL